MKLTTLCYLEQDDKYLMLHRIRKKHDVNKDKWIGIGGKFEKGESPEDCLIREAMEETGYRLTSDRLRGVVTFLYNDEEAEYMFLYTADGFEGEPVLCDEGTLEWVRKDEIDALNLWEGDRIFFELLKEEHPFFSLKLHYRGDSLEEAVLDGTPMELLDVLDADGNPTGLVRERGLVHKRGDFHRTSHIWIARRRQDGGFDLLLQKRSREKESFPGCYDTSSAGHVPAGSGFLESAVRELSEELGIACREDELSFLGFYEEQYSGTFFGKPFRNHELGAVYVYTEPVDEHGLSLQESEVEAVCWMDMETVLSETEKENPGFCLEMGELLMVKKYLEGLR